MPKGRGDDKSGFDLTVSDFLPVVIVRLMHRSIARLHACMPPDRGSRDPCERKNALLRHNLPAYCMMDALRQYEIDEHGDLLEGDHAIAMECSGIGVHTMI